MAFRLGNHGVEELIITRAPIQKDTVTAYIGDLYHGESAILHPPTQAQAMTSKVLNPRIQSHTIDRDIESNRIRTQIGAIKCREFINPT